MSGDLLRLATAGSVDDGKSTLVGRLLHDASAVLADQLAAVERASRDRGRDEVDLSLLTDGLRAEREQGITIDVAYRYFATAARKFVLADTPGHVEYTRNTVTGMSRADVAVLLVDARHGVVEQTRRHVTVAALLRVPHVTLAVNKMDLVGWDEGVFDAIAKEFTAYAQGHGIADVTAIPVSALRGDNVVDRGDGSPWYAGPTLLEHLETVDTGRDVRTEAFRYPVQNVLLSHGERWYAGQVSSGVVATGDEIVVLPSQRRTRVVGIDALGTRVDQAYAPMSVALRLADEIAVSRGDLIAHADTAPTPTQDIAATVAWLAARPLQVGDRILLRHGTRTVKAMVRELVDVLDVTTMVRTPPTGPLASNDVARVVLRTAEPLPVDTYAADRRGGAFLIIDEADGATLAAGLVGDPLSADATPPSRFDK